MRANSRLLRDGCFSACWHRCTYTSGLHLACWLLILLSLAMIYATPCRAHAEQKTTGAELSNLLPGAWRGVHSAGMTTYHHRFTVIREGTGYTAQGIAWCGMSEAQAEASLHGDLDPALFPNLHQSIVHPMCVEQQYTVTLQDDTVTFQSQGRSRMVLVQPIKYFDSVRNAYTEPVNTMLARVELRSTVSILARNILGRLEPADPALRNFYLNLFNGYPPDRFSGHLIAPGIVAQDSIGDPQAVTFFRFWKEEALSAPRPPTPELGTTLSLACLDGSAFHYTCYLPHSYRPDTPMPVLMNFSPSGNAQPLSPELAEKFGWIMVGLKESRNGPWNVIGPNRDAVLFDLQRRFKIDMKRLYFSGFSGGGRAAGLAAFDYPDRCAGVICIGASCIQSTPPRRIPIYFLVGETDMNRNESTAVYEAEKKAGRITALALHPGGHTWGSKEEQETALRWLANPKS